MRSIKLAACVALMTAGVSFAAVSANAAEPATLNTCLDMAAEVKTAMASNMQAASYDDAKKEQNFGRDYCTNSFYARGVAHYSHALQLLGVTQKS
jgi:hypothetical protein